MKLTPIKSFYVVHYTLNDIDDLVQPIRKNGVYMSMNIRDFIQGISDFFFHQNN